MLKGRGWAGGGGEGGGGLLLFAPAQRLLSSSMNMLSSIAIPGSEVGEGGEVALARQLLHFSTMACSPGAFLISSSAHCKERRGCFLFGVSLYPVPERLSFCN